MKKLLVLGLFLALGVIGCGGKSVPANESSASACIIGAPEWVLAGNVEGGLSAVGSAKIGKAGINFARTEALATGRDEIARILALKVNNMFKNFVQSTGVGNDETVDKVSATVSKQVASQMISGSKQVGTWISPCDEFYVLVAVDAAMAQAAIKEQTMSSFKNDQALWQQFQAQKAQDELDAAINTEFKAAK